MPSIDHIHTYSKMKRKGYYKCLDPLCTHFAQYDLVIGKMSKCCLCTSEFVLTKKDMDNVKPRCLKCSNSKEGKLHRASSALISDLFKGLGPQKEDKL
jgi:hypothetical protein